MCLELKITRQKSFIVCSNLKHLLDLPSREVDVELVEELVDLIDVEESIPVLVGLLERLLQPRPTC